MDTKERWGLDWYLAPPAGYPSGSRHYRPVLHLVGINGRTACGDDTIKQEVSEDKKYLYRRCKLCQAIARRARRQQE